MTKCFYVMPLHFVGHKLRLPFGRSPGDVFQGRAFDIGLGSGWRMTQAMEESSASRLEQRSEVVSAESHVEDGLRGRQARQRVPKRARCFLSGEFPIPPTRFVSCWLSKT